MSTIHRLCRNALHPTSISEVLNPVIFKLYETENEFFCKGLKEIRLKVKRVLLKP